MFRSPRPRRAAPASRPPRSSRPPRRLAGLAALCAVALGVAACGSDTPSTAGTADSAVTAYPVTVTADNGEVTLAAQPTRIVSLSASLTEMLFAVDAGDQVIAVDKYSNYPEGTPQTELSGFKPNVEAIAALDPDLVVLPNDREGIVAALDAVGIPTLLLTSATSIDDALEEISTIAAATGHPAAGAALVASIRSTLEELHARVPARVTPLTYYYELTADGHSATSATFVGSVLALAGMVSIADTVADAVGGFPQLSYESILAADPDVILLAHGSEPNPTIAELAERPGWASLRAVRDGNVVDLDGDIASRWGPRIVDLLRTVIDATETIG